MKTKVNKGLTSHIASIVKSLHSPTYLLGMAVLNYNNARTGKSRCALLTQTPHLTRQDIIILCLLKGENLDIEVEHAYISPQCWSYWISVACPKYDIWAGIAFRAVNAQGEWTCQQQTEKSAIDVTKTLFSGVVDSKTAGDHSS